jgi:hypothetical protein
MKYVITANEANRHQALSNEGLMESTHEFKLTEKEAKKLGFIKDNY